jgi:hypothetical protein
LEEFDEFLYCINTTNGAVTLSNGETINDSNNNTEKLWNYFSMKRGNPSVDTKSVQQRSSLLPPATKKTPTVLQSQNGSYELP